MKDRFILSVFFLAALLMLGSGFVYADSDKRQGHEEDSEALEEISELLGWGTVAMGVVAGAIFPLRRYSKGLIERMPSKKDQYRKGLRMLAKFHPVIGAAALGLGVIHGYLMFLHEGGIEGRDWLGIMSVGLFIISALFGWQMVKKKKNFNQMKQYHIVFILVAGFAAIIHIVTS